MVSSRLAVSIVGLALQGVGLVVIGYLCGGVAAILKANAGAFAAAVGGRRMQRRGARTSNTRRITTRGRRRTPSHLRILRHCAPLLLLLIAGVASAREPFIFDRYLTLELRAFTIAGERLVEGRLYRDTLPDYEEVTLPRSLEPDPWYGGSIVRLGLYDAELGEFVERRILVEHISTSREIGDRKDRYK